MKIHKKKLFGNITLLCFLTWVFFVFLFAESDYSYDYIYYMNYIEQIEKLSFLNILKQTEGIYLYLTYSSGLEVGFALILKTLSSMHFSPSLIFAFLATFSCFLKIYVMRYYQVSLFLIILICLYSIILLESNALRSALSLSFFLLFTKSFLNEQIPKSLLFLSIATLIHVQSLFFITIFFLLNSLSTILFYKHKVIIYLTSMTLFLSGFIINHIINNIVPNLHKLAFYEQGVSLSSGLNSLSLLSVIALGFCIIYMPVHQKTVDFKHLQLGFLMILSSIPALSIYLFMTNVAVLGDRLWQWGLIVFTIGYCIIANKRTVTGTKVFLSLTLFIALINITIRYPLSNFFYPLIEYVDFNRGTIL